MKFVHFKDLFGSLQELMSLGGKFGKAAAQVSGILREAQRKDTVSEVFSGISTTNNGESRIKHCIKYDLQGACRLVTVQHNNICFLMFAGTHDKTDSWLEANKGIRFHLKTIDGRDVIESTRTSENVEDPKRRLTTIPDFSTDLLWKKIPQRYFDIISDNLPEDLLLRIKALTSIVMDDQLFDIAFEADLFGKTNLIYDTFDLLRGGFVQEAKSRIDLYYGDVKPVEEISTDEIKKLQSGDEVVLNDDVDPVLFDHFLKTATFQKWMVYLHPGQREYVNRDFNGPARLAGVSGSGKTSVLIHRAVRLARASPDETVLVITLNRALAKMIRDLTETISGETVLKNLVVLSFWELCRDLLARLEPANKLIYWDKTVKTNPFAESEHIDEIWKEYFECKNNNLKAKVLAPLQKTLLNRGIFPADYIRQEFDYLRSALGPFERSAYMSMDRDGRSVALEERYRQNVIAGLAGWEEKMTSVGAIDYLGLATALYKHIDKLAPTYRSVLIDEMQDFGCVELKIIRAITHFGQNDIFMCGDSAQSVLTKYHKISESGIDISGRSHSIRKNYRNSREILGAAFELFETNKHLFSTASNIEILDPEYANFSSSPPLLLRAADFEGEVAFALGYLRSLINEDNGTNRKFCLAVCGYNQPEVESLGAQLGLQVLTGDTDVVAGQIFITDLEQTKGFEFDSVLVLNCSATVIPHPALPSEESYRELCKLYVAMTRAKTELIVSYVGAPSPFLIGALHRFTSNDWSTYAVAAKLQNNIQLSEQFISEIHEVENTAEEILFLPQAVGLSTAAQEKLVQLVTGTNRFKDRRQVEWKNFDSLMQEIRLKSTLRAYNSISDGVWSEYENLHVRLRGAGNVKRQDAGEKRTILRLPKQNQQSVE
jgi:superfamily I DNA/RNA helicase